MRDETKCPLLGRGKPAFLGGFVAQGFLFIFLARLRDGDWDTSFSNPLLFPPFRTATAPC